MVRTRGDSTTSSTTRGRARTDSFNLPTQAQQFIDSIPGQEKFRRGPQSPGILDRGMSISRTDSVGSFSLEVGGDRGAKRSSQYVGGRNNGPNSPDFSDDDGNNSRAGRSSVSSMSGRRSQRGPRDTAGGMGRIRRPSTTGDGGTQIRMKDMAHRKSVAGMRGNRIGTATIKKGGRQGKRNSGGFGRKSVMVPNSAAPAPQR